MTFTMQLELVTPLFVSATETVQAVLAAAHSASASVVMIRSGAVGEMLRMLRVEELERVVDVRAHASLDTLPLHHVGVASSEATVRELESQLASSSLEAVAMVSRSNQVVALASRQRSAAPESPPRRGRGPTLQAIAA